MNAARAFTPVVCEGSGTQSTHVQLSPIIEMYSFHASVGKGSQKIQVYLFHGTDRLVNHKASAWRQGTVLIPTAGVTSKYIIFNVRPHLPLIKHFSGICLFVLYPLVTRTRDMMNHTSCRKLLGTKSLLGSREQTLKITPSLFILNCPNCR